MVNSILLIEDKLMDYEIDVNKLYTYNFTRHKESENEIILYSIQPYSNFSNNTNSEHISKHIGNVIIFVKLVQPMFVDITRADLIDDHEESSVSNITDNFNCIKLLDNEYTYEGSDKCTDEGSDECADYENDEYYEYHCMGYESY
jgi:hypothetical protein